MDSEFATALKIRSLLDERLTAIDPDTANRLYLARQKALLRYPNRPSNQFVALGVLARSDFWMWPRGFAGLTILIMLISVFAAYQWNQEQRSEEAADIESALLGDELPPEAYLDRGFFEWLEHGGAAPVSAHGSALRVVDEPVPF